MSSTFYSVAAMVAICKRTRKAACFVAFSVAVISSVNAQQALVVAISKTAVNLPLFVAEHEGYFAKEGVTVRIEQVASSVRGMDMLAEGKADVTTGSEVLVMFNSFKRSDFAIVATFCSSTEDQKVVAHPASGITSARQLANKRVGTILGSASHYYVDTLALLNDVDPKSMTLVGFQPSTIVAALARHEVDAISIWQPQANRAAEEISGAKALADGGYYTQRFNLIASRAAIGNRSDELTRLLRAMDRAAKFIADEPAKVRAILTNRLEVDEAFAEWLLPRYRFRLGLEQSLLTSLESEARWAREEGHVKAPQSPNYLTFIHAAPLARVRPAAVGISQ